jgi:hypothetical protein
MSNPAPTHPIGARISVVSVAICCTLALAACGSANKPTSAGAGGSTSMLKYSECMRSHGVPAFPDPSTTQGPNSFGIDGYNFNLPANLNTRSPAYESASTTCGKLINGGGGGPANNPAFVAKARQAALAHAECMRQHGVPSFPDPTFHSNGQGVTVGSGGPGLNPQSPAFQQAQKICQPK